MKRRSNIESNQKSSLNIDSECGTIYKVHFNKKWLGKITILVIIVLALSYLFCYSGKNSTEAYSDGQFKALLISQLQMANDERRLAEVQTVDYMVEEEIVDTDESLAEAEIVDEFKVLIEPEYSDLKKAYLTFDDGPSMNTERILNILDEYKVKGNFFVVGSDSELYRERCKQIVEAGHVLGMHSYTHDYRLLYATEDSFNADLNRIQYYIYDATGYTSRVYRFPGGSSNLVSKVSVYKLIDILAERGIEYYDWNVDSGDANSSGLTSEQIVNNVFGGIDKLETEEDKQEVMILMHDLPEKISTVDALPSIIEGLQARGYIIVPIDNSTKLIHHQNVR